MTAPRAGWARTALRAALAIAPLLSACTCGAEPDDAARLAEREDVTPVHFHVAMRALLLADDGDAFFRDVEAASSDREAAERVAQAAFARRAESAREVRDGTDLRLAPALPAVRAAAGSAAQDRALVLLGWLAASGRGDAGEAPSPILLYEASRLDPTTLPPPVQPFVHAMRAWAYGQGGLCDMARTEGELAEREPDPEVVVAAVRRLAARGAEDPQAILDDLGRVRRLLGDGARACCLLREGQHRAGAKRLLPRLADAEALGVDAPRLALLRAWAALAEGQPERAQAFLEEVRAADLRELDRPRYKMVRDTLASSGPAAADDALARLVDRRWLSQLTLEASVQALERDGLLAALETRPGPGQALALAVGEHAALDAARDLYPFFDRADAADRDLFGRFRRWLGADD